MVSAIFEYLQVVRPLSSVLKGVLIHVLSEITLCHTVPSGPNAHQRETCGRPARRTLLSPINLGEGGVSSPSNTPVYSTPTDAQYTMGRLADYALKVFSRDPPSASSEPEDDGDEGLTICDALQGALKMTSSLVENIPVLGPVHTACTQILEVYQVSASPTIKLWHC